MRELNVKNDESMIIIQDRASASMKHFFSQGNMLVIMGDTRIAEFIMLEAHYETMLPKRSHLPRHSYCVDCQWQKAGYQDMQKLCSLALGKETQAKLENGWFT